MREKADMFNARKSQYIGIERGPHRFPQEWWAEEKSDLSELKNLWVAGKGREHERPTL